MRKPKKALVFFNDTYHQNFCFLKDWTREQVEKTIGIDTGGSGGITIFKDDMIFIWVDNLDGEGVSHLVHECVHAGNFTLGHRGVKVSAKEDEAQAYLIQFIFHNCFKTIKRKVK